MFDIGFAELLIIGVVALLVIGPERLPEAVRTASAWVNRLRRGFNDIKQEVQQELHNDSVMRELRETGDNLRRETDALRNDLRKPLEQLQNTTRAAVSGSDSANTGGASSTPEEQTEVPETVHDPEASSPVDAADTPEQPPHSAERTAPRRDD